MVEGDVERHLEPVRTLIDDPDVIEEGRREVVRVFRIRQVQREEQGQDGHGRAGDGADAEFGRDGGPRVDGTEEVCVGEGGGLPHHYILIIISFYEYNILFAFMIV